MMAFTHNNIQRKISPAREKQFSGNMGQNRGNSVQKKKKYNPNILIGQ